jgi:PhnB protein
MTVITTTHLNFRGVARQALEHYQSVFGGRLVIATYADAGRITDPAEAGQVLWGQVTNDAGFRVMAFDVPGVRAFDRGSESFYVSMRSTDASEIEACWERLAVGATIVEALAPSGWSPLYGMLTDPFGVTWVLDVEVPYAA